MTESTARARSSGLGPLRLPLKGASRAQVIQVLTGCYLGLGAATWVFAFALAWSWLASSRAMDRVMYAGISLAAGAGLLALAAILFRQPRVDGMVTGLILLLGSVGLATTAAFDVASTRSLAWAWAIGLGMAGGALLHLATVFPRELGLVRRLPMIALLGYALAALVSAVVVFSWYRLSAVAWPSTALRVIVGWVLASAGVCIVGNLYHGLTAPSPVQRIQGRLIAGALLIGLSSFLAWYIIPSLQDSPDYSFLALPLVFPCIALGYSMFRFRVTGASHGLRQGMIYSLLVVLIVAAYGLVVAGFTLVFGPAVPASSPVWVIVLALAVALLVEPARKRLQKTIERLFFRGESALAETTRAFTAELGGANDLVSIATIVRRVLQTALRPESIHVFVYDQPAEEFIAVRDATNRPTTDLHFSADGPLATLLRQSRAPLQIDKEALPVALRPELSRLTLLGSRLFVPLAVKDGPLGWIALGDRQSGQPYSTLDMTLLENLGDQVSLALGRVQVVQTLERRLRDMNALTRVAQGVNITLTFDDVLELIYAQTAQIIPLTHFYITLNTPRAETGALGFALENNERVKERENTVLPPGMDLAIEVQRRGRPLVTADYELECTSAGMLPITSGIRSWMGVPLNTGAETIGVLSVGSRDPGIAYAPTQLELLQAIADQTAGAIVKAQLLRETQHRAAQLGQLNDVTRQLASTLDMSSLRQVIVDGAAAIMDCEAAIFYLADQPTGELIVTSVSGAVNPDLLGQSAPVGVGTAFRAAASRSAAIENDLDLAAGTHALARVSPSFAPHASIAAPLQFQDTLVGILEVLNRHDGGPFSTDDESLLLAFAGQAGVAIENVRLYTLTDQELTARVEELSVMQRIDRELNASLEMDRAMRITLEWALRQSNAEAGLIGLLESDRLRIVTEIGYGASPGDSADQTISLTFPGYQAAVDTALPQRVRFDTIGAVGFLPASDHQVVIPIRREAAVIGLLVLESTRTAQEDLGFLSRLTDHAAIAISNAQLYDEVQRANIAKSDFVSLVAHELKNPMTSIKGYTELLAAGAVGPVNEMQSNFLNTIRSNTERMSTLVSDLNDNSKIEAGKLRLDFKAVELTDLIEEILRSANRQVEDKKQQVSLELSEQLPSVWGDRTRLGQVLTNLVSNANKYTPDGGTLVIGAEPSPNHWDPAGAGQVVHLWVRDSGIGISPEDQERIFEKFFRSEDPKAREAPGAGLGLNITRSLVEMQGGRIWFESQHRHGTTFHFTVPVAEVSS